MEKPLAGRDSEQYWRFIGALFEGPLDIVGDVHGEIAALDDLLAVLGYDAHGDHPAGRRLVFVGDLTDRGPDSIAVVERVAALVRDGRAQCIAGNHELNLLRQAPKEGNGWFMAVDHDKAGGKFHSCGTATQDQRERIEQFFSGLPLALERPDLRVVHACWHGASIRALRDTAHSGIVAAFNGFAEDSRHRLEATGMMEQFACERRDYARMLTDPHARMPFLEGIAAVDEAKQLSNPVRVVTSGIERRTAEPFFAGGKWRMVERVHWWREYEDAVPVIFGHYWRRPAALPVPGRGHGGPDLFEGTRINQWLGPKAMAYCVDFSVGRRFLERERGIAVGSGTRLGAVRWPERELKLDSGETYDLG
jgi:hypothetical protein